MPRKKSKIVQKGLETPDPNKAALREDLEQQVKAFLKKGGQITQIPMGHSAQANLSDYRKGTMSLKGRTDD
jgi:hypothetical protein